MVNEDYFFRFADAGSVYVAAPDAENGAAAAAAGGDGNGGRGEYQLRSNSTSAVRQPVIMLQGEGQGRIIKILSFLL